MLATDRLPDAAWRKSSYSGGNEGGSNCVEVAGSGNLIAVRDSKNPSQGSLTFAAAQWRAFVTRVLAG
jgi:Domain of unknown function (DUF397)